MKVMTTMTTTYTHNEEVVTDIELTFMRSADHRQDVEPGGSWRAYTSKLEDHDSKLWSLR